MSRCRTFADKEGDAGGVEYLMAALADCFGVAAYWIASVSSAPSGCCATIIHEEVAEQLRSCLDYFGRTPVTIGCQIGYLLV